MRGVWVGIDAGAKTSAIAAVDQGGAVLAETTVPTSVSDIESALSCFSRSDIRAVAIEAGAGTSLVRALREVGLPIRLLEARAAHSILNIRRNKTDRNDARGLADLGRLAQHSVPQVHVKGQDCQRLRNKLVIRQQLVSQRVAVEQLIRSTLYEFGGRPERFRTEVSLRANAAREIAAVKAASGLDLDPELGPLVELAAVLRINVKALDRALERYARSNPVCRSFLEIPGVGPICAISFFTSIEDPHRFAQVTDMAAYLGLTPRIHQSGETTRSQRVSKRGNPLTRAHLVMAARVILGLSKIDTALRDWGKSMVARVGHRRAQIAVARKLAVVMGTMWRSNSRFRAYPSIG